MFILVVTLATMKNINDLTYVIRGAAFRVHKALGPGLLESVYETCLAFDLQQLGLKVERQRPLPVQYRGVKLDGGYRVDLIVEDQVILELKSVDDLAPVHTAQILTYLRLSGCRIGLLMNFNVRNMQEGIKRYIV